MSYPILIINEKRAADTAFGHPWLFSGAIEKKPNALKHGDLVEVADPQGKIVGVGTFSSHSSIAIRLLSRKPVIIDQAWMTDKIKSAESLRRLMSYGPDSTTTGYRVIFGEADGLPGLVVDRYEDVLVIQISTAGMDGLKPIVVEALKEFFQPRSIIERSDMNARREEGLKEEKGVVFGENTEEVEFLENGHRFIAPVAAGQKTGFFLDQKDLRKKVESLAEGRKVLNLFSYTGAAGIYALKGGAKSVLCVDSSKEALEGCQKNRALNKIKKDRMVTEESDIFQWLDQHSEPAFDLVALDPPALIKTKKDLESGKKAYHFLNRSALRLVADNGIFVTSSCSHFFTEEDFLFMLRRASVQAGVTLEMLGMIYQSPDHPVSLYFPESKYLKSVVARVSRN